MNNTASDQLQEQLYASAYTHYEVGEYASAIDFFTQLVLSDPFSTYFWKGLASSRQMLGRFTEALSAWSVLALLSENDPIPHFHAAECFIALGDKQEAEKAITAAEGRILSAHTDIKEKLVKLRMEI